MTPPVGRMTVAVTFAAGAAVVFAPSASASNTEDSSFHCFVPIREDDTFINASLGEGTLMMQIASSSGSVPGRPPARDEDFEAMVADLFAAANALGPDPVPTGHDQLREPSVASVGLFRAQLVSLARRG